MIIPKLPENPTEVVDSERGFARMPELLTSYGATVRVYESSAALHPHLWLAISEPNDLNDWVRDYATGREYTGGYKEAHAHMALEAAEALVDQLQAAITNHYMMGGD